MSLLLGWNCTKSLLVMVMKMLPSEIALTSPQSQMQLMLSSISVCICVANCKQYWCNVRVSEGEFSVLLCSYQSLIGVIMQVQAAMFWWPLTLSAYLIRLVTAAEEWKSPPLPQQHHSHSGNISLSIINATFQISPISQSRNSATLFMHAHWCELFDTVRYHRLVVRNHSRYRLQAV